MFLLLYKLTYILELRRVIQIDWLRLDFKLFFSAWYESSRILFHDTLRALILIMIHHLLLSNARVYVAVDEVCSRKILLLHLTENDLRQFKHIILVVIFFQASRASHSFVIPARLFGEQRFRMLILSVCTQNLWLWPLFLWCWASRLNCCSCEPIPIMFARGVRERCFLPVDNDDTRNLLFLFARMRSHMAIFKNEAIFVISIWVFLLHRRSFMAHVNDKIRLSLR